jgi:DNA-binding CsgD family transcriptional regulator
MMSINYRPSRHTPFYAYSSKNKKGCRTHPEVFRRKDRALTMWWEKSTVEEIATSLDISPDTVRNYLREGRAAGDFRAVSRESRRHMLAKVRRMHIDKLHSEGLDNHEIAYRLNVHVRLVQMRLKESSNAG